MIRRLLCLLGIHKWEYQRTYGESEDKHTKFEMIDYEKLVCKRCGKTKKCRCKYIKVLGKVKR